MSNTDLPVAKFLPFIEAVVEITSKLIGLYVVFFAFNYAGENFLDESFDTETFSETLFSLVILPALYILKDAYIVFDPFFISAGLSGDNVKVEIGILTKRKDNFNLANIENVELVTTYLGRRFGYGTLNLYAFGSMVEVPNIKDVVIVQKEVEEKVNKLKA